MSTSTNDSENTSMPEAQAPKPKGKRTTAKKATPCKAAASKKAAARKPKSDRSNKKAAVTAMMMRTKGATTVRDCRRLRAGNRIRSVPSSASLVARVARRSSRPRTTPASEHTSYVVHHITGSMRSTLLCGVGGVQRGTAAETHALHFT